MLKAVRTANEQVFEADAFILATGHSARDIYRLLHHKKISIELKPFALGVRVEHPSSSLTGSSTIRFATQPGDSAYAALPPASYSTVTRVNGRGVFSFCMCPGGIIAPASTSPGELVVNGWSPSKRNNPYANSGIVVTVEEKTCRLLKARAAGGPCISEEQVERKTYDAGGGRFVAPRTADG